MRVLGTCATKNGSMQQVAEAIAATLRASELGVDVLRARQVISGEGWDLLVPGTPLQSGR